MGDLALGPITRKTVQLGPRFQSSSMRRLELEQLEHERSTKRHHPTRWRDADVAQRAEKGVCLEQPLGQPRGASPSVSPQEIRPGSLSEEVSGLRLDAVFCAFFVSKIVQSVPATSKPSDARQSCSSVWAKLCARAPLFRPVLRTPLALTLTSARCRSIQGGGE